MKTQVNIDEETKRKIIDLRNQHKKKIREIVSEVGKSSRDVITILKEHEIWQAQTTKDETEYERYEGVQNSHSDLLPSVKAYKLLNIWYDGIFSGQYVVPVSFIDFNKLNRIGSIHIMGLRCAECQCSPEECHSENDIIQCKNCIRPTCCCIDFHRPLRDTSGYTTSFFVSSFSLITNFLGNAKGLYAAALGIEILCIAAAEIGENSGLYLFGFNTSGIAIAYVMGYALAGFTTFVTIVGRFSYNSTKQEEVCSCCSVLEQNSDKGFMLNLKTTFRNFGIGIKKLPSLHRQPNLKNILKTSLVILVTAESACILTAETVDLIFYKYSIFLSVPLALLAGAFTVMMPAAYRKIKAPSSLNF